MRKHMWLFHWTLGFIACWHCGKKKKRGCGACIPCTSRERKVWGKVKYNPEEATA